MYTTTTTTHTHTHSQSMFLCEEKLKILCDEHDVMKIFVVIFGSIYLVLIMLKMMMNGRGLGIMFCIGKRILDFGWFRKCSLRL